VERENPSRRRGCLKHPFYVSAPHSDACHVGQCLDGAPNTFRGSRSNGDSELLRAHRLCFLGNYSNRPHCDLERVRQGGPLDLVRNVFDRVGMGIPGSGISGVPLEEHAPYGTMASAHTKGPRAPTRIRGWPPNVAPHGAWSRPSGQNVHFRPGAWPDEASGQALRPDIFKRMTKGVQFENPSRRLGRLEHPFYARAPFADANNVAERADYLPNQVPGHHSLSRGRDRTGPGRDSEL